MKTGELLKSLDWVMLGATGLLVLVGLAMLFSSTYTNDLLASRFIRQLVALSIALVAGFALARIPYHSLKRYAVPLYLVGTSALLLVFLAGEVIRGTTSRLELAGFQLQPSEFMKVVLILTLAWFFTKRGRPTTATLVQSTVIVAIPVAFIILEPDLGVAMLLLALWASLLIFLGTSWRAIAGLGVVGVISFVAAWQWLFADYQKLRLLVFLDPTRDPLGAGYNIFQSIVALGSGRFFGRGLGHGPQSQLQFLPERHTDFILASIGEELGFVGVLLVLALYAILLWRILLIARSTRDPFGQLIAVGTFLVLLISLIVSAGMNMGLLPVTGIPLPLLSYGGSNLLSTFLLLALVQSVHVYSKWVQAPPTEIEHLT